MRHLGAVAEPGIVNIILNPSANSFFCRSRKRIDDALSRAALYRVGESSSKKKSFHVNIVHEPKARVHPLLLGMKTSLQKFWACLAFRGAYVTPAAVHRGIGSLLGFCIQAWGLLIKLLTNLGLRAAESAGLKDSWKLKRRL